MGKLYFNLTMAFIALLTAFVLAIGAVAIQQNEVIIENQTTIMSLQLGTQAMLEEYQAQDTGYIEAMLLTNRNWDSEKLFPGTKGIHKRFVYKRKTHKGWAVDSIRAVTYRPRSR